jgi:Predicted pPIWI-associating nuclease
MANSRGASQTLRRIDDSEILQSIMVAVSDFDLASSNYWDALDQLSSHTEFEALEANPAGIFEGPPGMFQAIGTVYVTLNYGDKRDSASMSDSYPVQLSGKFDRTTKLASIESVKVDTSSFYS